MLALGVTLGAAWLVNPLLAGITVIGIYVLLQELYDRRLARLALLLVCTSPWFIFMAMSFMSHTFALACAVGAAISVIRARKTHRAYWGWVGGLALGVVSLIRPLEGAAL